MNRKISACLLSLLLLLGTAGLGGCGAKEAKETLNLYTWEGMFPQEVLDAFEENSNIDINYTSFDYNEDMLAKLEEAEGGSYDLVIADDYILEMVIEEGLAQKLDTAKISTYSNINPLYQSQFYDPENQYTVPYGAGIPLIVYNPDLVDVEITSYSDLWSPALEDSLALLGNYRVVEGMALKTLGQSFNTEDLDAIRTAGEKLLELAPNVRVISDSNVQDYLLSGEVGAAFMYTSQVIAAVTANPDLKVVYPTEGLGFGIMAGFIPAKAPNAEAAYKFLSFINEPENSAKCFEYIGYYCTNKAAESCISTDMQELLVVPESVTEGESIQNISQEAEDLHSANWAAFRQACG